MVASGWRAQSAASASSLAGAAKNVSSSPVEEIGVVAEPGELPGGLGGALREGVVGLSLTGLERGIRDGPVAGAAAQIAREPVVHGGSVRTHPRVVEGEEAHHEPGGAETALRSVGIDHCTLHGMQVAVRGREVFHGDDLGPVDHSQKQDAAIRRLVDDATVAVEAPQRDGAGAAVALRAAFLGAECTLLNPEMIEEGLVWREIEPFDNPSSANESNAGPPHDQLPRYVE